MKSKTDKQLEALLNESALIAVGKNKEVIDNEDIDDAFFKIVMQGNKKRREEITKILDTFQNIKGYKDLKARNIGPMIKMELTVLFDNDMKIYDCHKICDEIEHAITNKIGNISIIIHSEPEHAEKFTVGNYSR